MSQEVKRILAIRHGQTAWNADGRIQGHTDIALNAAGREQGARLGPAIIGEMLAAVYTSDPARARDTAQAVADATGAALFIEPARARLQTWRRGILARLLCALRDGRAARMSGAIALVAHGGVLDCLYRAASGAALEAQHSWPLTNAALNRLLFVDGRFVHVGWIGDAHLLKSDSGWR